METIIMSKRTIIALLGSTLISSVTYANADTRSEAAEHSYKSNFGGAYVSVYTGYAQSQFDVTEKYTNGAVSGYTGDISPDNYLLGIMVGYDWELDNNLIVGVAFDYEDRNASNAIEFQQYAGAAVPTYSFGAEITSSYSLTTRLGYIFNRDTMVYVKAGITNADVDFSVVDHSSFDTFSKDVSFMGYTMGLGAHYNLWSNFQLFIEYQYSDYGSENFDIGEINGTSYQYDLDLTENAFLLGVSYKF